MHAYGNTIPLREMQSIRAAERESSCHSTHNDCCSRYGFSAALIWSKHSANRAGCYTNRVANIAAATAAAAAVAATSAVPQGGDNKCNKIAGTADTN